MALLRKAPALIELPGVAAALLGRLALRRAPKAGTGYVSDEEPTIIAGMHRSGTSIITDIMVQNGMYVGGRNVDEHQESLHFSRANRAMLGEAAAMLYEFGWTAPKTTDFMEARRGYAERAAGDLPRFFAGETSVTGWGWKDPRNCLTLDVWLSIFPRARVLHILRDGRIVALSLADRDALDPSFAVDLWAHYTAEAERAMEQLPGDRRFTIRYEDFLEQPRERLAPVLDFAGLAGSINESDLAKVDPGIDSKRREDPRLAEISEHPLLEKYGYGGPD